MSVCRNCQSDKIPGMPCGVCGTQDQPKSELAEPTGSVFVPCPFCGSVDIAPAPRYSFPVSTRCNDCGATGPQKLTGREADAAWALRATSAPPNAPALPPGEGGAK